MVLDDPPVLLAHIGAQDRGSEFCVILRRQHVADIVQQGADNSFGVGSVAQTDSSDVGSLASWNR